MAGHIPKSFIDELIARADIVEIIGARDQKGRARVQGLLPFPR